MNATTNFAAVRGLLALSIAPKTLADALNAMKASGGAGIIEKRNTIPILGCVLLDAQPDKLTIYGTDLDVMLVIECPAAVDGCGRVAVEFEALHKAAKSAKGDSVRLVDMGTATDKVSGRITFQHDGGTASLPTRLADDFPMVRAPDDLALFAVDGPTLKRDLDRTATCISDEETRYYLGGVFFHEATDEYGRSRLRMAATDGHRLARIDRERPADMPEDMPDAILPKKSVHWIRRVGLKGCEGAAYLHLDRARFVFQAGRMRLVGKLIDGTFPDYSRVIPAQGAGHRLTFAAEALADAAKLATGHGTSRTKAMLLSVGEGWATVRATCPESGAISAMIEGSTFQPDGACEAFGVGVNAKYLGELMRDRKGETVTLTTADAGHPILIKSAESPEFTSVLMPVRVDGAIYTPEDMRKATRDALTVFAEDAPRWVQDVAHYRERLASIGQDKDDRRAAGYDGICQSLEYAEKQLGKLAKAAIDLLSARTGQPRNEARQAILCQLADMKGEDAPLVARAKAAAVKASTFPVDAPAAQSPQPEPMPAAPDVPADIPPQADEPAPVETPDEYSARIRASQPMFATLQEFKAAAGVGTRWSIENFDGTTWGGYRVRTVATVRARDIGFLGEDATLAQCIAASGERGHGGRSWVSFPKQPDWESDPEGLVIYCPANAQFERGAKQTPILRLRPVPLEAVQPVETAPIADAPADDVAALRALVLDLAAKVEALEAAGKAVGEVSDALAPVAAVEGPETRPARSQAHERAVRRAWAERSARRASDAARRNLCQAIDVANAELAQKSGLVSRLTVRVARLTGLLAGRKRQIKALGRDLLIARNRAADLRAAGETVPPIASVPTAPKPAHPSAKVLEAFDDAADYAAAC